MEPRPKGSPLGTAMLLLSLLAGVLEVGLTTMSTGRFAVPAFSLFIGLWLAFALCWTAAEAIVLRLAFGRGAERAILRDLSSAWQTWLRAPSPGLLALLPALTLLLGASVAGARVIVEKAHDPTWIALAIVGGQVALVFVSYLFWQILRRLLAKIPFIPSGRVVIRGVVLAGATVASAMVTLRWDDLALVGATALLLPVLVILFAHVLVVAFGSRGRLVRLGLGPIGVAFTIAICLVAVVLGEQSSGARMMVGQSPWTVTYLRSALGEVADMDRDGSPAFPFGDDCAPFDRSINPLAAELVGNDVDENCDGSLESRVTEGQRGPPEPLTDVQPDLVLITVDALRADHLGFMGYDRPISPELDREAEGGVVFQRGYSQDSGTAPSLWSMMTGKSPFQADLVNADRFPPALAPSELPLAELLSEAGYRTEAHLCGHIFVVRRWNIRRGFDVFEEVCGRRRDRQGPMTASPAVAALRRGADDPPLFLWVHFFDPHKPYFDHPGTEFGSESMDLYDEEIHYIQRYVAQVVRAARSRTRHRPTFVFMTADHGENFREHGRAPHARTLYREVTHVPVVVWGPDLEGRRVDDPVASSDVYPTFLDLAHVATPTASSMWSLVPVLRGEAADPARVVYQENSWSRPRRHVKGLIRGRYHYLRDVSRRTTELYDLLADPGETEDLSGTGVAEEDELSELMDAFVPTTHLPEELR